MPEATVDEDHLFSTTKHDVRSPGKIFRMQSEAMTSGVKQLPDDHLRSGVPATDATHHGTSFSAWRWFATSDRSR